MNLTPAVYAILIVAVPLVVLYLVTEFRGKKKSDD